LADGLDRREHEGPVDLDGVKDEELPHGGADRHHDDVLDDVRVGLKMNGKRINEQICKNIYVHLLYIYCSVCIYICIYIWAEQMAITTMCWMVSGLACNKRNRSHTQHTRQEHHHKRPHEELPRSLNNDRRWRDVWCIPPPTN